VEYGAEYGVQWAEKTFEKLEAGGDADDSAGDTDEV
jgi:hypothetical protein